MAQTPRKSPTFDGQLELNVILPCGDAADRITEARPVITKAKALAAEIIKDLIDVHGKSVRLLAFTGRIEGYADGAFDDVCLAYRGAATIREGKDPGIRGLPPLARTLAVDGAVTVAELIQFLEIADPSTEVLIRGGSPGGSAISLVSVGLAAVVITGASA